VRTTAGDLVISLFSRECPLAVRNFTQLCANGAYDHQPFHRIVPETLIQFGNENNDLSSFDNGVAFKDEFHSRLEFRTRGFVAMANEGKPNTNRAQIFITLKPCPWLNKKHTIFGIIKGEPVYIALKIGESPQENERALQPHRVLSTTIIEQPFPDSPIFPNISGKQEVLDDGQTTAVHKQPKQEVARKRYNRAILSFMTEEEDDDKDEDIVKAAKYSSSVTTKAKRLSDESSEDEEEHSQSQLSIEAEKLDQRNVSKNEGETERDTRLAAKLATLRAKKKL
jgi:peptidyl-prolyl cis-trans isomerase SDCCAG10